jgi:hypothetical protein
VRPCSAATASQFSGHGGQDAEVAGGVIAQGLHQLGGHQTGIAGLVEKMLEAGHELVAFGMG